MYYLLCDICCQGMLEERELCEVGENLFKGYLNAVINKLFMYIGMCENLFGSTQMGIVNGWFVSFCVATDCLFVAVVVAVSKIRYARLFLGCVYWAWLNLSGNVDMKKRDKGIVKASDNTALIESW